MTNIILDETEEKSCDTEDRLERYEKNEAVKSTDARQSFNRARFMGTLDLRFACIYSCKQTSSPQSSDTYYHKQKRSCS